MKNNEVVLNVLGDDLKYYDDYFSPLCDDVDEVHYLYYIELKDDRKISLEQIMYLLDEGYVLLGSYLDLEYQEDEDRFVTYSQYFFDRVENIKN
jgi:hypothetical protein